MIFTYNKEHVGDVLMVIVAEDKGQAVQFERKGQVARVFLEETGKTVAWNILKHQVWLNLMEMVKFS